MADKPKCLHEVISQALVMLDRSSGKLKTFYYRCDGCKALIDAKEIDVCPPEPKQDKLYAIQY